MKKTDNAEFLAKGKRCFEQTSLPLSVDVLIKDHMKPEQRRYHDHFMHGLRIEAATILNIVNRMFPDRKYTNLKDVSNDEYILAKDEYDLNYSYEPLEPLGYRQFKDLGVSVKEFHDYFSLLAFPDIYADIPGNNTLFEAWGEGGSKGVEAVRLLRNSSYKVAKPSKQYKPYPLERKQRLRVRLLIKRLTAKYSIPELYCDELQGRILKNPRYYGVCPLPGAIDASPVEFPSESQQRAIEREMQVRDIEARRIQPIKIPLAIPNRELLAVEVTPIAQEDWRED